MSQDATGDQQPTTGLPEVDKALAGLADLEERPVAEHPEALAAVHEVLHQTLQAPSTSSAPATPSAPPRPPAPGQAAPRTIHRSPPRPTGT